MDTTTLQVPLSKKLKAEATKIAKANGFSSLQGVVRVLLTLYAKEQLNINFLQSKPKY